MGPSLLLGVWERPIGSTVWKYVPWGIAGAALGKGARIALSEGGTKTETNPGRIVVVNHVSIADKMHGGEWTKLCSNDPDSRLLTTWIVRKRKLNFLCSSWEWATKKTFSLPTIVMCVSKMLTTVTSVSTAWDAFFGERVTIWETQIGQIITDGKDGILRLTLRDTMTWDRCSAP